MIAASNAMIADLLRRYASAIQLEGADRFKVKAYRRAAETIEMLHTDVAKLAGRDQELRKLPGIGQAISGVISEIVAKGAFPRLERAISNMSPEVAELATRPNLDRGKVLRIYKKLGINTLAELGRRLETGEIAQAFGDRVAFHIRRGLDTRPRLLLRKAEIHAAAIERFLETIPGVADVARVGSLRRKQETVGDLNFLVSGGTAGELFDRFGQFGGVLAWKRHPRNRAVFQFSSGLEVSLVWTKPGDWGLALIEQTGSKDHLQALRARSTKKHIDLAPAPLRQKKIDPSEEQAIYRGLGMVFIEPELREGRDEIEAAAKGRLPRLIRREDLKGDLHMHTVATDGANTIEEMAAAARERGYQYIAITDHSQSLKITNGLSEKRLLQQVRRIDRLNSRSKDFVIFKSAEVDILEDGSLDYPQAVLKELDLTICSIHSKFARNREHQTERVLRAMDNPYFNILGHATGRLLLQREGYELDLGRLIEHARANGCYFEINSSPNRLDLSDEHARLARENGVKIAVNTDAHSIAELDLIGCGLNQARRGWLEPGDVLNTRSADELRKLLRR